MQQPLLGAAAAEQRQRLRRLRAELVAESAAFCAATSAQVSTNSCCGRGSGAMPAAIAGRAAPRRQRGAEDVVEPFL